MHSIGYTFKCRLYLPCRRGKNAFSRLQIKALIALTDARNCSLGVRTVIWLGKRLDVRLHMGDAAGRKDLLRQGMRLGSFIIRLCDLEQYLWKETLAKNMQQSGLPVKKGGKSWHLSWFSTLICIQGMCSDLRVLFWMEFWLYPFLSRYVYRSYSFKIDNLCIENKLN